MNDGIYVSIKPDPIHKIVQGIKELKETFSFVPPQAFSYSKTFSELTDYIEKAQKVVIIGE